MVLDLFRTKWRLTITHGILPNNRSYGPLSESLCHIAHENGLPKGTDCHALEWNSEESGTPDFPTLNSLLNLIFSLGIRNLLIRAGGSLCRTREVVSAYLQNLESSKRCVSNCPDTPASLQLSHSAFDLYAA